MADNPTTEPKFTREDYQEAAKRVLRATTTDLAHWVEGDVQLMGTFSEDFADEISDECLGFTAPATAEPLYHLLTVKKGKREYPRVYMTAEPLPLAQVCMMASKLPPRRAPNVLLIEEVPHERK